LIRSIKSFGFLLWLPPSSPALAKFMEQAFEWEIMDYTFYPYYWANRKSWQEFRKGNTGSLEFLQH
ncbi:MAG: hypothetical protein JNN23_04065, partial [Chryseobacterium gambrini]|nr:hypothetical protein [Chryseobacterium gambrini]